MFAKNRSRLASALFDGDGITHYFTYISNDLQFKYWSKLISKHSCPFNKSFDYNNTNSNTDTTLKLGLTTLIAKNKQSNEPSHYRPITMSSILCRLLHKILARRMESTVIIDPRQKHLYGVMG